jgi:hypothetical protein
MKARRWRTPKKVPAEVKAAFAKLSPAEADKRVAARLTAKLQDDKIKRRLGLVPEILKRGAQKAADRAQRLPHAIALEAMDKTYQAASGVERDRQLLGALILCGTSRPLPIWLFVALRDRLTAGMPQEPGLHLGRWIAVTEAKREVRVVRGSERKIPWRGPNGAFAKASKRLAATPWAGTARTMRESYDIIQREVRKLAFQREVRK